MITCIEQGGVEGDRKKKEGTSYLVLMPSERGLVERLEGRSGWEIKKKRILDKEEDESMESDWQKSFESWTLDTKNTITLTHKQSHHANAGVHNQEKIAIHELAVIVNTGTLRAHATHKAEMREMLHPRNLHLGHLAACFGLAKAPSLLLGNGNKKVSSMSMGKKRMSEKDKMDVKRARMLDVKKKRGGEGKDNNLAFNKKQMNGASIKKRSGRSVIVSEFGAGDY